MNVINAGYKGSNRKKNGNVDQIFTGSCKSVQKVGKLRTEMGFEMGLISKTGDLN